MSEYKFLININEVKKGTPRQVKMGLKKLTVYFNGEKYFVFDSHCPHARADLTKAKYDKNQVKCHWHGYIFNLENGEGKGNNFHLKLYKVKIEDDKIFIKEKKEEKEDLLLFPEVKFKGDKNDK
ncbi:ferredoxin [Thermotomaculum hydrothermale]|uniref:Ferredoxin n=1 Tax=Thermotomaculum hydrothermale TaxID=981385 RepID=A0A7R6PYF0_9BACT|nr:Rieske 2Fe-2S domain-containing protein [Thermotomaculum hydrothermale]BBB33125.1 ferredoxin [Thermotomaculum hydrothermale]